MTIKARKEYLNEIRLRYQKSTKKDKTVILNEFCKVCRYSRSYAVRILTSKITPTKHKRGRKAIYGPEVVRHLKVLWELTGRICSKKLKFTIPLWLPHYRPEGGISLKTKKASAPSKPRNNG